MIWKLRPIISAQNWIKKSAPSPPHEEADGKAVGSIINDIVLTGSSCAVKERRTLDVHHTGSSDRLALRQGNWVLVDGPSGDNAKQEPEWFRKQLGVIPHDQAVELFNLKDDPQQTRNLAGEFPEKVQQMKHLLEELEQSGRSRK
jgi:hypothetical protein